MSTIIRYATMVAIIYRYVMDASATIRTSTLFLPAAVVSGEVELLS